MTQSEIMKAAHRQAARLVCPGLMSYRQALSIGLKMMHKAARDRVVERSSGYAGLNFSTIKRDTARDAIGIPVG